MLRQRKKYHKFAACNFLIARNRKPCILSIGPEKRTSCKTKLYEIASSNKNYYNNKLYYKF